MSQSNAIDVIASTLTAFNYKKRPLLFATTIKLAESGDNRKNPFKNALDEILLDLLRQILTSEVRFCCRTLNLTSNLTHSTQRDLLGAV